MRTPLREIGIDLATTTANSYSASVLTLANIKKTVAQLRINEKQNEIFKIMTEDPMFKRPTWVEQFTRTMAEWHAVHPTAHWRTEIQEQANGDFKLIAKAKYQREQFMGYYDGENKCAEDVPAQRREVEPAVRMTAQVERLVNLAERVGRAETRAEIYESKAHRETCRANELEGNLGAYKNEVTRLNNTNEELYKQRNQANNELWRIKEARKRATAKAKKATKAKKPAVKK